MGVDVFQALEVKELKISDGGSLTRLNQMFHVTAKCGHIGATAGWLTNGDTGAVQLPASQTDSTFIIPLGFLKEGWVMDHWRLDGQMDSAGNDVTLIASLRKMISLTGVVNDTEVDSILVPTKSADYKIVEDSTFAPELIGEGFYYVRISALTNANTNVDFMGVRIRVKEM